MSSCTMLPSSMSLAVSTSPLGDQTGETSPSIVPKLMRISGVTAIVVGAASPCPRLGRILASGTPNNRSPGCQGLVKASHFPSGDQDNPPIVQFVPCTP